MGAKFPNPAPNRRPDGSIDVSYAKPTAPPAPPYDRSVVRVHRDRARLLELNEKILEQLEAILALLESRL